MRMPEKSLKRMKKTARQVNKAARKQLRGAARAGMRPLRSGRRALRRIVPSPRAMYAPFRRVLAAVGRAMRRPPARTVAREEMGAGERNEP